MSDATADSDLRARVRARLTPEPAAGSDVDVAVVGAGPGGLYTAWRLVTAKASPYGPDDVTVLEQSARVGGRLDSIRPPGLDAEGELGGMRFEPDAHRIVDALTADVFSGDLDVVDFPLGEPEHHLRYLRGQRFRADAWRDAQVAGETFETRYHLDNEHRGFSPGQLFRKVIYDVLAADPWFVEQYGDSIERESRYEHHIDLSRREWNEVKRELTYEFAGPYEGLPVQEMGMWAILEDRLGHEGYEFLTDAMGYYALTANWNAAQAMADVAADFAGDPDFKTLARGFDRLPYALADAYLDAGGTIRTENALRSFRRTPAGPRRYALDVEHDGGQGTVTADRVVLALPRGALEDLDQYNFFFDDPAVQRHLESVFAQPALKLLMAFEDPWWERELGAHAGASVTDLPIRQCYYFGTNAGDERSLFLASYDDERAVTFWSDLAADGAGDRETESGETDDELRATEAPERMVEVAMAQVRELHDADVPDPYAAYYKNWGDPPYGGGYNHWKPDVSIRDAMRFMRDPDPAEAVHVVGSAYSGRQGWVEGAFCTAEKALQESFGLARPPWLDSDYYLGW
ncbi:flavin monoamine oxidase family protein [Halarchaeum sp. P4]|uniref:flavin monoamine oxidase family protein n=1 Tax=Halarchaeum sp. P4 TaxID=3421639 RepID=UPI003EB8A711